MSSSTAELTLLLKAKDLATGAMSQVGDAVDSVKRKAGETGRALGEMGGSLSAGLGNLTENLLTGQGFGDAALNLGAFLAGETVQEFGTTIVSKLAGSAVVQAIGGALSAMGATVGSVISAAIPVGMAAAPLLILAAVVAAIAFLVTHPEVVAEATRIAGTIVRGIVGGLAGLAGTIVGLVVAAPGVIVSVIGGFVAQLVTWFLSIPGKLVSLGADIVGTIVRGMSTLPGQVADTIRQAFANLRIDVGPFHIRSTGITIDLPNLGQDPRFAGMSYAQAHGIGQHAGGGWAGLHGPELSWLGENGPEYVIPNDQLGRGGGGSPVTIPVIVDGHELARIVDERLYYLIQGSPIQRKPA